MTTDLALRIEAKKAELAAERTRVAPRSRTQSVDAIKNNIRQSRAAFASLASLYAQFLRPAFGEPLVNHVFSHIQVLDEVDRDWIAAEKQGLLQSMQESLPPEELGSYAAMANVYINHYPVLAGTTEPIKVVFSYLLDVTLRFQESNKKLVEANIECLLIQNRMTKQDVGL